MVDNNNKDSGRGLASSDQETRERVARDGGRASHGGQGGSSSSTNPSENK